MDKAEFIQKIQKAFHHHAPVVVFAVLGMFIGGLLMTSIMSFVNVPPFEAFFPEKQDIATSSMLARSAPTHLRIPSIGLDTTFEGSLGLNDDKTIEVPDSYEEVGWYKYGATPGEIGAASILGHVDSKYGPAVFHSLKQVKKGDLIEVDREDKTTAIFKVDEIVRYDQNNFPNEKVYGRIDYAGLRLITCAGVFDKGQEKFSHNLVVYASLVAPATSE